MATAKQIAANRANAQKSTGPRTPEGKAKCKLNPVSHGFAASTFFLEGEDPEEFYGLQHDLNRELQPATYVEQILVEKMAHNQWLSLRAIRLQSDALYFGMKSLADKIPTDLGLLIRYQTAADRAFHRAHAELLKAQKERVKSEIGLALQNENEPTNTDPAETPQTPAPTPENAPAPENPPAPQPETAPREHQMAATSENLPQAA